MADSWQLEGIGIPIMAPYRRLLGRFRVPSRSSKVGRLEGWKVINFRTFELSNLPTRNKGQATIELAIVAIFILLPLLIGIADITRAYFEHLAVVDAANVGAR